MNDTKINSKTTSSKPKELYVHLENPEGGEEVILMNNGVTTSRIPTEFGEQKKVVLQGDTAFRGFIGTFTELFGYRIKNTWTDNDVQITEDLV